MPVKRGEIVLAELPFSDGSGSKVRPALVVQCDHNNRRRARTLGAKWDSPLLGNPALPSSRILANEFHVRAHFQP
jgi:hypothetical protein